MDDKSYTLQSRKRPIFDRRTVFFSVMVVILFGILVFFVIQSSSGRSQPHSAETDWTAEQQKKYANALFSRGLKQEAITAYENYLEATGAPGQERAKIAYRIGNLYIDIGKYEKALANLYRVELEHPSPELTADIGHKVVACLERLDMTSQAQYELESRTAIHPDPDGAEQGGVVIARIGKAEITMGEIDAALDKLPEWMRKEYESEDAKLEFAKQYVANELLYRKAKRLGLDEKPATRLRIAELTKSLMVRQVIENELQHAVKITPADVKSYYNANQGKYAENAMVQLSVIQVDYQKQAEALLKQLKSGEDFAGVAKSDSQDTKSADKGGEISGWIPVNGYIPEVGVHEEVWKTIDNTDKGGLTDIVEVDDMLYVFQVRDKKPEVQKPFSEVKDQVAFDCRRFRDQQAAQALLARTLEQQEVEIYDGKFR